VARRITITTTTERLLILGNLRGSSCAVCGGVMFTAEQVRILSSVPIEKLNGWLESGAVHSAEQAGVPPLVCLPSLLNCLHNDNSA